MAKQKKETIKKGDRVLIDFKGKELVGMVVGVRKDGLFNAVAYDGQARSYNLLGVEVKAKIR